MPATYATQPDTDSAFAPDADGVEELPDELTDNYDDIAVEDTPAAAKHTGESFYRDRDREKKKKNIRLTQRDYKMLTFVGRFQYAYAYTLTELVAAASEKSIKIRCGQLREEGLLTGTRFAGSAVLWKTTKDGNDIACLTFGVIKDIAPSTVQHTVALTNIAAPLEREEAGGRDVLEIHRQGEAFPPHNRFVNGLRLYKDHEEEDIRMGEMTVTEREIRKARGQAKFGKRTREHVDELRYEVRDAANDPTAPELDEGNEHLFVVYGASTYESSEGTEHVPDLVVLRPRDADGRPHHKAIELELSAKSPADYTQIMRAYARYGHLYDSLYYFTNSQAIKEAVLKAAIGEGMILEDDTEEVKAQKRAVYAVLSDSPRAVAELRFRDYKFKDKAQKFLG